MLLDYLLDNNIIYSHNYSIYHNNKRNDDKILYLFTRDIDLVIVENNNKSCSCCIKNKL